MTARQGFETAEEMLAEQNRKRLALAGRIAAGMCANPNVYKQHGWQGEVARNALAVADKLVSLVESGGC